MAKKLTPEMFLLGLLVAFAVPGLAITAVMSSFQQAVDQDEYVEDHTARTPRLVVFETSTCSVCKIFRRRMAPHYLNSNYHARAPLTFVTVNSHEAARYKLKSGIFGVPTFVYVDENNREIDRIRGLPAPRDRFYDALDRIM